MKRQKIIPLAAVGVKGAPTKRKASGDSNHQRLGCDKTIYRTRT